MKLKNAGEALLMGFMVAVLVAACGGGGGGGGAPAAPAGASLASFYVNPATGNDATGTGAAATPYKTLTKAIQAASAVAATSGANIYAASGVYNTASGETFPLLPTNGENIVGSGIAEVEGSGNYTIVAGDSVSISKSTTFAFAPGQNGSLSGIGASGVAPTFVVTDNATVTLSNNQLTFPLTTLHYPVWAVDSSVVTITNNTISGWVTVDTSDIATKVTLRGNTLDGGYTVCTADFTAVASQLDLGTAASPGNNILKKSGGGTAIVNSWGGAADQGVTAVGNTWIANMQGADAVGHYASAHVAGPVTTGPNYNVKPTAGIQF